MFAILSTGVHLLDAQCTKREFIFTSVGNIANLESYIKIVS